MDDKIDFREVTVVNPERRPTQSFVMRAPGAGVLEFEITPITKERTRLTSTAYWHPAGVWGLLYWSSLEPAHWYLFSGLSRGICRRAEDAEY